MNFTALLLVSLLMMEITIIIWSTVMGTTGGIDYYGEWKEGWYAGINWLTIFFMALTVCGLAVTLLPPCRGTCH